MIFLSSFFRVEPLGDTFEASAYSAGYVSSKEDEIVQDLRLLDDFLGDADDADGAGAAGAGAAGAGAPEEFKLAGFRGQFLFVVRRWL